ncbi:MAG TPA: hypothetical protein PLO65_14580 [Caulobacter sp.]|nr:hypothetical protein [Caulobacter sp.]
MTPVRPNVWANVPPPAQGSGQGAARSAAQRAFFDAALGKAATTTPAQPQTAPAKAVPLQTQAPSAPQPLQRTPSAQPDEPPARILRPGSLLDIRV